MSKVQGIDVSHWNNKQQIITHIRQKKPGFMMVKATEGSSYRDNTFNEWIDICEQYGMIKGAYHYARPDKNTARVEAEYFVRTIEKRIGEDGMLLALDWEGTALKYAGWTTNWCLDFLERVKDLTGIKPLIYMSESAIKPFLKQNGDSLYDKDYGLWVAKWSGKPVKQNILPWKFWAIHQYTNRPFDKDEFNGSIEQLRKYAAPVK